MNDEWKDNIFIGFAAITLMLVGLFIAYLLFDVIGLIK